MVPLRNSQYRAARLPQADLHVLQDTSHNSILRHFGPMMDTLFSE